jgi:UDP-glucose 4-epimerase
MPQSVIVENAVVTGAGGFLGSHLLCSLVKKGYGVTGLGRSFAKSFLGSQEAPLKLIQEPVTVDSLIRCHPQPDIIFHCAGGSSVPRSVQNPEADYVDSIESTRAVLRFTKEYAPNCKVVYSSSAGIYGDVPLAPISEEQPENPCSPYGYHKSICEKLLQMYGQCFGIKSVRVRLFSIYGEGLKKQILWDSCNKATRGEFWFSGTGDECRDLIYIEDATELLIASAKLANSSSPILNGGNGVPTRISELVSEIGRHFPNCPKPRFDGVSRVGDPKYYWASIEKCLQLGWKPRETWRSGVKRYCDWYKVETAPR